jgi:hypothetical protein
MITFSDPYPSDGVALDPATGVVAAINGDKGIADEHSTRKAPLRHVRISLSGTFFGFFRGAFEKDGNLYIAGETSDFTQIIGVIRGGSSAKSLALLSTSNTLIPYHHTLRR